MSFIYLSQKIVQLHPAPKILRLFIGSVEVLWSQDNACIKRTGIIKVKLCIKVKGTGLSKDGKNESGMSKLFNSGI